VGKQNTDVRAVAGVAAFIAVAKSLALSQMRAVGRSVSNIPMTTVAPDFMSGHSWHRLIKVASYLTCV
jgi:hypothetical protein